MNPIFTNTPRTEECIGSNWHGNPIELLSRQLERELATSENQRLAALSMLEDARREVEGYKASQNLNIECYHDRLADIEVLKKQLAEAKEQLVVEHQNFLKAAEESQMERDRAIKAEKKLAKQSERIGNKSLDTLLALASTACALDTMMRRDCGYNEEWPIQIIASTIADKEKARELSGLLSNLAWRTSKMKCDGDAFRALMGWQAKQMMEDEK